jgi:hypothetical protein
LFLLSTQIVDGGLGLLLHFLASICVLLVGGTDGFLRASLAFLICNSTSTKFAGEKHRHDDEPQSDKLAETRTEKTKDG